MKIKVWDLPTRIFHWLLVLTVSFSLITGLWSKLDMLEAHILSGYLVFALLVFRVLWGFLGSNTAKFSHFIYSPKIIINYLKTLPNRSTSMHHGHNPVGGLMVIILLLSLLIQAITGLFTTDDIFTEGPLVYLLDSQWVESLTSIHHLNGNVLLALIGLHVFAILFYWLWKKQNLTKIMITGVSKVEQGTNFSFKPSSILKLFFCLSITLFIFYFIYQL